MELWEWDHLGELRDNEYWIVISSGFANRSGGKGRSISVRIIGTHLWRRGKGRSEKYQINIENLFICYSLYHPIEEL